MSLEGQMMLATGLALLFSWFTVKRGSLTLDGAAAASALGLWVLWWAGAEWLAPLFFFFGSSVMMGRMAKRRKNPVPEMTAADPKHTRPRDFKQVLCNGGIYALLASLSALREDWQAPMSTAMLVSLAVSTADTWASELGIFYGRRPMDILRWRKVPPGLSGGITLAGTLAGLVGSAALAVWGWWMMPEQWNLGCWTAVTGAGFSGMVLDSILGAALQARYRTANGGMMSDSPGKGRALISGWVWMSNDAVNIWSNVIVTSTWILVDIVG